MRSALLFFFFFFFLCSVLCQDECDVAYNSGPRGENRDCPAETPYCIRHGTAQAEDFCSECNPAQGNDWLCDCPAGLYCEHNQSSPDFGRCAPYPKDGQACGSKPKCRSEFSWGKSGMVYYSLELECFAGRCQQCDPYALVEVVRCQYGTKAGSARKCLVPGHWVDAEDRKRSLHPAEDGVLEARRLVESILGKDAWPKALLPTRDGTMRPVEGGEPAKSVPGWNSRMQADYLAEWNRMRDLVTRQNIQQEYHPYEPDDDAEDRA